MTTEKKTTQQYSLNFPKIFWREVKRKSPLCVCGGGVYIQTTFISTWLNMFHSSIRNFFHLQLFSWGRGWGVLFPSKDGGKVFFHPNFLVGGKILGSNFVAVGGKPKQKKQIPLLEEKMNFSQKQKNWKKCFFFFPQFFLFSTLSLTVRDSQKKMLLYKISMFFFWYTARH